MTTLDFKMNGKFDGLVELADFSDFAEKLNDVLRIVFRSSGAKSGKLPSYEIYRLEIGSACCGVKSIGLGAECIGSFLATTEAIRNRTSPPIRLSSSDARQFKKLADTLDRNVESIVINEKLPIDSRFVQGCDWLIASSPRSYGEAIGRLESLNLHKGQNRRKEMKFRIYPEGMDRGAECCFPETLREKVLVSVDKRVKVAGLIHRDLDGVGIDRITEVRSIEPVLEDNQLPSLRDLFGLFEGSPVDIAAGWED